MDALIGKPQIRKLVADAAGRGSFRCLDEDEDVERALAEPEIVRAFALNAGDAPPPTLADLPQREAATTKTNAKGTKAKKDARSPAKASAKAPALPAKPPPRLKKITARAPGGLQAAARLAGGDVVLIGLFGSWMRGRLETNTWASSPRGLGKQWWITTEGRRIWLGTDDGLFVSDDDGITFVQRRPWAPGWTKPLFVEGAIIGADGGELCRSTDDGVTWVQTFPREPSFGAIAIARGTGAHGSRLVAVGIYGRIARSDDLGQTWTMAREGNDEAFHHVCVDGDDVYVLGSSRILRAPITSPGDVVEVGPAPKRDVEFRQVYARDGFVWIAAPLHLLRSRDRGATWEILAKAETVFKDVLVLGPRHLLVATSDQLAYEIEG